MVGDLFLVYGDGENTNIDFLERVVGQNRLFKRERIKNVSY